MRSRIMSVLIGAVILLNIIAPSCFASGDAFVVPTSPTEEQVLSDILNKIEEGAFQHPYIHGSLQKINEIKSNIQADDEYSLKLYANVKNSADKLLDTPIITGGGYVSQSHSGVESRIMTLMTVYFIDGNESYLNRALEEFRGLETITRWTADAQLDNTQSAAAIAICYDWLYDYLNDSQKEWAVKVIKEKSLDIAYRYYKDPSQLAKLRAENDNMNIWCWRGSYNHCVYNNSNLALSALAIAPLYPEYSAYIISNNLYNIQPYFELVGENGGHEESVGYYGYTTGKAINMLSALNSSLKTMYGYENYPGFKTTAYYPLYMYGAGPFSFGDTARDKAYFESNFLYFTAKHSHNAELMSVISKRFDGGNCIKPLLWYDAGELDGITETHNLDFDRLLYPVSHGQNIASFRDNWNIENGFYAAMYVGCATANGHSDASSGAFCLDAFGERFVTPMGTGNYSYPGYWDNTENGDRWNWYEKRPEGANCLVINPSEDVGQDISETAVFDRFESSDASAYAISDLSDVYGEYTDEYNRGIKVHKSRSRVVIQDEAIMKAPSEVFWSFNTPAAIEIKDNNTAILTNNGKKVIVKLYSNVDFELYTMASEKLLSSPQTAEQMSFPGYRKLALKASGVTKFDLMAEFIPIANEYEMTYEISEFVPMSEWDIDEENIPKPTLDSISIDGVEIENFDSCKYNYELYFDRLDDEEPLIEYVNSKNYDVNVSFTDSGLFKAVIEVKNGTRSAWYVINMNQNIPADRVGIGSINYTKFKSAMYKTDNPSYTGDAGTAGKGWLPHLYSGGVYRHYYCTVDISSLSGKTVTKAFYKLFCGGNLNISVYSLDGDFVPGSTPYANLPSTKEEIASYKGNKGNGGFVTLDLTKHVAMLAESGKDKLNFVIVQKDASTTCLAGEKTYTDWKPSISVEYITEKTPFVISDISLSENNGNTLAEVSFENNSGMCHSGYVLFVAAYEENKLKSVSLCRLERIMPYRTKTISTYINSGTDVKAFLWHFNPGPIPVDSIRK